MKIPKIIPVTDLRMKHIEVFGMLDNGPVILAQRSRPAAVLVSVQQWDRLMERLEDQDDLIEVLQAELDIATDKTTVERLSEAEIAEWSGDAVLA
jgi:PHD/YefM family antitoxin component YafN of YafNO toxin-antitoxin module